MILILLCILVSAGFTVILFWAGRILPRKESEATAAARAHAIRWAVTGTRHGAIIYAGSEGAARRAFHKFYGGESIVSIKKAYLGDTKKSSMP